MWIRSRWVQRTLIVLLVVATSEACTYDGDLIAPKKRGWIISRDEALSGSENAQKNFVKGLIGDTNNKRYRSRVIPGNFQKGDSVCFEPQRVPVFRDRAVKVERLGGECR